MCAEDAGRAAALDLSEAVARQTNTDADATSPWAVLSPGPQINTRSCRSVLHVTVLIIPLVISNATGLRGSLTQLFKVVLSFRMVTQAR